LENSSSNYLSVVIKEFHTSKYGKSLARNRMSEEKYNTLKNEFTTNKYEMRKEYSTTELRYYYSAYSVKFEDGKKWYFIISAKYKFGAINCPKMDVNDLNVDEIREDD
jgi:hypothetical protein